MDLQGAWLLNTYYLCSSITGGPKSKLRVNIPYYQRPYKWEEEHIDKLISDFFEHMENKTNLLQNSDGKEYFAGSIVTVKKEGSTYHDIVDGQQRITTVFLLSYLRFLILRSLIDESISRMRLSIIKGNAEKLEECYTKLIGEGVNCNFTHLTKYLEGTVDEIESSDSSQGQEEKEKKLDKFISEYKKIIKLPSIGKNDELNYKEAHEKGLKEMFEKENLSLTYSRSSLNNKLKEALSKIFVIVSQDLGLKVEINKSETEELDPIVSHYCKSIIAIYKSLYKWLQESSNSMNGSAIEQAIRLIKKTEVFLEYLRFCLIRTGNENDAYTLFEVLNDRALEVDDLDLIKNLFYRKYSTGKGKPDDENMLDKQIEELEDIWGEKTFTQDIGINHTKLIAYLGVVFLTGDASLDFKTNKRYRGEIEKYFNDAYVNKDYVYKDIYNEFKIFNAIRLMIADEFNLPVQPAKSMQKSLKAEDRRDVSITYKAIHLINALNYRSVIPSLVNIILRTYLNKKAQDDKYKIDLEDFKDYLKAIINDKNHEDAELRVIHDYAHNLWRLALLSKNYEIPRELARMVVQNLNYRSCNYHNIKVPADMEKNAEAQFKSWSNSWRYDYNNKYENFKVKLLLYKLFQAKKGEDENKLGLHYCQYTLNTEELELEHVEARRIDANNKEKYFEPRDPNDDRNSYVESIGNLMIMDKKSNITKSQSPTYKAIEHYKNMGIDDHWLIKDIDNLLNRVGESRSIDDRYIKIPNEEFFNTRKEMLRKYILSFLKSNLDTTEITIVNNL